MGNVILGLLLLSPMTLYSLNKQFEAGVSLFYSASLGSIRTALLSLLERGLVTVADSVENGRSKKTYSITPAGHEAFVEWMHAPPTTGDLETTALAKLYLLGLMPAADRHEVLDGILTRIRTEEAQLQQFAAQLDVMELPEEYHEIFRYQRLTLDYGLQAHRHGREFFEKVAEQDRRSG